MIYFDNAATTLKKPECVVRAVTEALCSLGNSGRGVHSRALSAPLCTPRPELPIEPIASVTASITHRGFRRVVAALSK